MIDLKHAFTSVHLPGMALDVRKNIYCNWALHHFHFFSTVIRIVYEQQLKYSIY